MTYYVYLAEHTLTPTTTHASIPCSLYKVTRDAMEETRRGNFNRRVPRPEHAAVRPEVGASHVAPLSKMGPERRGIYSYELHSPSS